MKQLYIDRNFKQGALDLIHTINGIVGEYQRDGYVLTVRQLYYQLVARDVIPNTLQEYKRVAGIINDAKLAGLIDWDMIEDRTRDFVRKTRWESGSSILAACITSFHKDMWEGQDHRVFVIIEKEALVGVLEKTCNDLDIPLLAARGYPSGSVLREFAEEDIIPTLDAGQTPIILHLGDHDPSGIDMTRDLQERLSLFSDWRIEVKRIALNMHQVEELRPPKNPAKVVDPRFASYASIYGQSSWELDALPPEYLSRLVREHAEEYIDMLHWEARKLQITKVKNKIRAISEKFKD